MRDMTVAALYDIHGNIWALEAVLREMESSHPDVIIFGGDVAYGPKPAQVMRTLRSVAGRAHFVKGNADRYLVDTCGGVPLPHGTPDHILEILSWCAARISQGDCELLDGFLPSVALTSPTIGEILFVHATPDSDEPVFTDLTPVEKIERRFAGVTAAAVVCGHTHIQFERRVHGLRVVNSGSVGKPFGEPGADWLLIDEEGFHFRHTAYDTERAAAAIRASDFPLAGEWADDISSPPSRAEAVAWHESRKKW